VQTAAVSEYLKSVYVDLKNLRQINDLLGKSFETKADVRKRAGLEPLVTIKEVKGKKGVTGVPKGTQIGLVGQALRDNSNRLPLESSDIAAMDVEELWTYVQTDLFRIGDYLEKKTLAQIIPGPFFHDVKYMNTKMMETGLEEAAWTFKDYDKY
jgi:hypothetical protein